jgi:hypothetical protein
MNKLDLWTVHDESVSFRCPCGGVAVGRFVLPDNKRRLAIVGTCQRCHNHGDNPSSFAYMTCEQADWKSLASVPYIPLLRGER